MLLVSVVAKRDRGTIWSKYKTKQIVGEIPGEPNYWEPIYETALKGLIEAGIAPPLKNEADTDEQEAGGVPK